VFGLSFGELVMLLLVAVVVLGPKELPGYLRKAGIFAGKLRRMAYDMRAKSGIDEVLRSEGIGADIAEIRRLATFARGELGGIMTDLRSTTNGIGFRDVPASPYAPPQVPARPAPTVPTLPPAPIPMVAAGVVQIDRAREYPTAGADSYGALPEGSKVYEGELVAARSDATDGTKSTTATDNPESTSQESDGGSPAPATEGPP
jgi:sec-independent protein translocase protein TatB